MNQVFPFNPPMAQGGLRRIPFALRRASGGAAALVYPLDEAGALPLAAYGNARLTSAYSGPCWRVARPSDSAELDIGFDGQWVDEATLSTFLGTETGRLRTWYDLTGNGRHMDQPTAGLRAYVKPGYRVGGGVAPSFMGTSGYVLPAGISLDRQNFEFCGVLEHALTRAAWGAFETGAVAAAHSTLYGATSGLVQSLPQANVTAKNQTKPCWYNLRSAVSGTALEQDTEVTTRSATTSAVASGGYFGRMITANLGVKGQYAFAAFYSRALAVEERMALRTWADSLWRCVSSGGVLILNGDSIMASAAVDTLNDSIGHRLYAALTTKPKVFNFANGGGQLVNDLVGSGASDLTSEEMTILTRYTSDRRVVFVFKGTNDLGAGGRTPAQLYADLQSYCASIRGGGGLVVVSSLLPRTSYGLSSSGAFDTFNANVRANWASFADGFVDYAVHPVMAAVGASTDTTLYSDGLHPTAYGQRLLGEFAAPEINRVFALP